MAYLQRVFIPVFIYIKISKSIKIFQSYDHKCTATFFMNHSVFVILCIHQQSHKSLLHYAYIVLNGDVKRGQKFEAKAEANEAKLLSRP